MRFVAEKSALERVCGFVCPVADSKINPIIACVKIEVGKRVTLTATDLDIENVGSLDAQIVTPGAVCVSAELFHNLVKCAPKGSQIEVELKNERLSIRSGRSTAKLDTMPVDGFPHRDLSKRFKSPFQISGAELAELFDRVSFAVSIDRSTQHYLCGINLMVRGESLISQATDSKVFARFVMALPEGCTINPVTVPTPGAAAIKRLTATSELPVTVGVDETLISARVGDFSISSKLVTDSFPDCDRLIPQVGTSVVGVRDALVSSLSNLSKLVERSADKMRECIVTFKDGSAEIVGRLPSGEFRDEVEVGYHGDPLRVCFNISNILDSLSAVASEDVELSGTPNTPWIVCGKGDTTGSLTVCSARVG